MSGYSINNMPVIILFLNQDQTVGYINNRGCQLLGYSREEVIGKRWITNFVVHENKEAIELFFQKIMEGEVALIEHFENQIIGRDGTTHLISWNSRIVKDGSGKITGIITFGEDYSDKKVLLKALGNQLQFSERQLQEAIEEAKYSQREEIASELHDNINQMLTTSKLLLEQETAGGQVSPLVSRSIAILDTVIKNIRDLSHHLSPLPVRYTDFELSVKEFVEEVEIATGLAVHFNLEGKHLINDLQPAILSSLYRVIQEQISNIVKHAKANQVTVTMKAVADQVTLQIEDDGCGFELQKVVPGLGLNSMQNRVKLNKGTMDIKTALGGGCTLSVVIPLK